MSHNHASLNQNTQPLINMPIFNNWDVVTKGWYLVCASREISLQQAKSFTLCGQRIVIFRGKDSKIRALDAFCPHLGTDLAIGKVDGNLIRCFFHHWAFSGDGICQDIPCQKDIPSKVKLQAYATDEKYGFIWVYPDKNAPQGVAEFDELMGKQIISLPDKSFTRNCHHHICMMNGIDAQHLQTVHKLNIQMELSLEEYSQGTIIDFTLSGKFPQTTAREKIAQSLIGEEYAYTMRYADGCIGLLTIMKKAKIIPPLHMIYAYTPLAPGVTRIQPIYVTAKRQGIFGFLLTHFLLLLTRLAYYFLRGEDGMIYDNIRYNPNNILNIDTPLVKYMQYVNQLQPAIWSK
ncbi:aromatic ring-hydroxylating oxygenase subunit alpha [Calothrix sp. 336/3]|uniref:aromatic ring-hydroxylating oxygenase subunit alpha n=1 Tax=Calothrix sp. 336/3 TaxID=1337936 RepID=UPI0005526D57|nr:aromatic ring-hydroxylating dioxygenase subunit alpha [Calothrix sp. 336/3]AKG22794.1 Rieske (2Fe-2S) protein [Calothrix sp. 336/3]